MNVSLTKQLEKWVRDRVKSGEFGNASEVVRDALRRVRSYEDRIASLRAEIGKGVREADAGLGYEWSSAEFKRQVRAGVRSKSAQARRRSA